MESATSNMRSLSCVFDVIAKIMIGEIGRDSPSSNPDLLGKSCGSCPRAALIAACTSRPAASILRFRSNCSVMEVLLNWLLEVISETLAIRPNWRSSGVATRRSHRFRAGSRKVCMHLDGRKFDLRKRRYWKKPKRYSSGQRERHRQQRGRDRFANEGRGKIHLPYSAVTERAYGSMTRVRREPFASRSKNR